MNIMQIATIRMHPDAGRVLTHEAFTEVGERSTIWVGDTVVSGFWIGAGSWCWDADPT